MSYFKAKMHQIRFRLGLRPHPAGGAHSAPPDPLAGFQGSYWLLLREGREMRGKERRGGRGEEGREEKGEGEEGGEGSGGERSGGKERPYSPPVANSWLYHWTE